MSPAKRIWALRIATLTCWAILTVLAVGPVLAQDGGTASADGTAETTDPSGLDELAARLAPLLVGAALIERSLEFVFNWVERAVLDCSHFLHGLSARITGLVTVDLRTAWGEWNKLASALIEQDEPRESPVVGNPESADPADWPLAMLEAQLVEAREKLEAGQAAIEKAMDSPVYIARKRMAAGWLSMTFGIMLAAFTGVRLFAPLGMHVPNWFDGPFDILDLILAGILMGLGTEWVHQVIGLLIQGKGLLGRSGMGQNLDVDQIRDLAILAVQEEFGARLAALLPNQAQQLGQLVASSRAEDDDASPLSSRIISGLSATTSERDTSAEDDAALPSRSTGAQAVASVASAVAAAAVTAAETGDDEAAESEPEAAPVTAASPIPSNGVVALRDTAVTVRRGGAVVRREPDAGSQKLGDLRAGEHHWARGLAWRDATWLQIPWEEADVETAWIPAEQTDFPRSHAYTQVSNAWYESDAVLDFRRALIRDLLRVRSTATDRIEQVGRLSGEALLQLEQSLARQTMLPEYVRFWDMQASLGLPDPFEYLPVHPSPPALIDEMEFIGFGPNSFAFSNAELYYDESRGLHTGVDYVLPEGSPLIAVGDGVIEAVPAPDSQTDALVLRPYLPRRYRNDDGSRQLSNVVVYYEHLVGDPTSQLVGPGDEVSAGQIIGTSGWPMYQLGDRTVVQRNNPHLHVEVHLVTDGEHALGQRYPFNPLLFWTPRLIAFQARLAANSDGAPYPTEGHAYGRLGFFSVGVFEAASDLVSFWDYQPEQDAIWPPGVYNLDAMLDWLRSLDPYAPARHQTPAAAQSGA